MKKDLNCLPIFEANEECVFYELLCCTPLHQIFSPLPPIFLWRRWFLPLKQYSISFNNRFFFLGSHFTNQSQAFLQSNLWNQYKTFKTNHVFVTFQQIFLQRIVETTLHHPILVLQGAPMNFVELGSNNLNANLAQINP